MQWRIDAGMVERAREIVRRHARETPLVPAPILGEGALFKLETEQETGSFKLRGALAALDALDPRVRARGVVTASAGNHGYGLARAGALFGVPVTVFVSRGAPAVKREGIARAGAAIEVVDAAGYDDVEAMAKRAAVERGLAFVSPFDDPAVAAGNGATLGLEILDARPGVRTIVFPGGGGGLAAGLAAARDHRGASMTWGAPLRDGIPPPADDGRRRPTVTPLRSSIELIGVQSEACPAMVESLAAGRALTRFAARAATLAEGLEGGVSEATYAIARASLSRMEAVSERAIADAMRLARAALDLPLEGSAAVALAWALAHRDDPSIARPWVVVLTGRNVDPATLDALTAQPG